MNQKISLVLAFVAGAIVVGAGLPYISKNAAVGGLDTDQVKSIVRDVIKEEPRLIIESVQNLQNQERAARVAKASDALKDDAIREALFNDPKSPYVGPKDAKKVLVEFFDYNCPACKLQFTAIADLVKNHKDVKVVFKEYPIFGPQSDKNAQIALAVNKIDRSKYFEFHEKMFSHQGRIDEALALKFAKEVGLDPEKVKKEAGSDEVKAALAAHRDIGNKIIVQGTPTVVVGDTIFPHAISAQDIKSKLNL